MRSRLMLVLALCVLMLPLLNACAAAQEASVPSLASRAAAAVSAAEAAHVARTSALKAAEQLSSDFSGGATTAASGAQPLWQEIIDHAKTLKSSPSRNQETATQPFWDSVLNRIRSMNSASTDGQDAFSLPSIWRSVYESYRGAQISHSPGGQRWSAPQ